MPRQARIEAFFLASASSRGGQRFCLYHPAQGAAIRGQFLYIHPLAEEMNKSRRMAAQQSRALSAAGFSVLQIDLLGCGDSSGDFGDATWSAWIDDVLDGCLWLRSQLTKIQGADTAKAVPLWLWGLRSGCLLAADVAPKLAEPSHFLFWAPAPNGKPMLQQFLRLKAAGDMLSGGAKGAMEGLRRQLTAGETVEVAGYALNPALASGLEQSTLRPPVTVSRLEWMELSTRVDATMSPLATQTQQRWRQAGHAVRSHLVTGPAFWQTAEIEDAPSLIAATLAAVVEPVT